jgi:hypothetical protein
MSNSFNFDEALKDLQAGKDLTGKDGILIPLIKQLTEAVITAATSPRFAFHGWQRMPIQNWSQALSQLDIDFEGRLDSVLNI